MTTRRITPDIHIIATGHSAVDPLIREADERKHRAELLYEQWHEAKGADAKNAGHLHDQLMIELAAMGLCLQTSAVILAATANQTAQRNELAIAALLGQKARFSL